MPLSYLKYVFILFFFISCQSAKKEIFYLGAVLSISGPAAWLGTPEKKTLRLLEKKINEEGGIKGKRIKILIENSEGIPTKAINAIKKLVAKEHVLGIIGGSRSGTSIAMSVVAAENEIAMISCASAEGIIKNKQTGQTKKWVFTVAPKSIDAAKKILKDHQKKKYNKIAILSGKTDFGEDGRRHLKTLIKQYGLNLVADETYLPTDIDMTAQLTKIRRSNPHTIINWSIVPAQSIVSKNMKTLGIDIPLYQSHGYANIKYIHSSGSSAEGILLPGGRLLIVDHLGASHAQFEVLKSYRDLYESEYGEKVSTFGGHAYDAFSLFVRALKKGATTRKQVRDTLEQTKSFIGTGGIFNFSKKDHSGLNEHAFEMIVIKDQQFKINH